MKIEIQEAINWIDGNITDEITLKKISDFIGYSEFHTSRKFKEYTGSTLRNYIMLRRLSLSAKELRDTNVRIIDTAIKYGFSSQEAYTKSFFKAFNINPGEYVKTKKAIPLVFKKDVLYPDNLSKKGEIIMVKDQEIKITLEETKEHKFIYLERDGVDNYIDFWTEEEKSGKDCNLLHGILASIPGEFSEGYGAFTDKGYIFGKDANSDYEIDPKYGFKEKIIATQKYLKFEHPGFSEAEFGEALNQVRRIALKEFDFELKEYTVDDSFVKAYEHSGMEICFYFVRIPLKST
ncbi:Multiple antibiotic resistance protein MarA [Candidatus Izimaplasma bacterium HR1]|jgi:AraC-like DNA-binding protein|uniref:helix-turn-helix transcriptional regulator n=1 Tax=Candidatus Izimoplasma sp. HR1 TaxID=1541959 RepID=UPI0004F7A500|nr:Multiple antibiotic resistance protein MarA [Candidatus Izimaplasma bacterium HR1]